eukprot:TRINITY_DN58670_c0_g1_i1.p1 TRINITY_DN58670_c0_g1~~TRINITY_DN58670_c0_g1_i1.p1  ORF type:complete len:776 (+),score=63.92 TRINITY_DN58670_c0_g1_i1:32-2359(+)
MHHSMSLQFLGGAADSTAMAHAGSVADMSEAFETDDFLYSPSITNEESWTLSDLPALTFLPQAELDSLMDKVITRRFLYNETVQKQGVVAEHMYLIVQGTIRSYRLPGTIPRRNSAPEFKHRVGDSVAPSYWGEKGMILGQPCEHDKVVGSESAEIAMLPKKDFMQLLQKYTAFRHAVGRNLSMRQDLFEQFRGFTAAILTLRNPRGLLDIDAVLEAYNHLQPALHPGLDKQDIDIGAWTYAVRRLPNNLTSNYMYHMSLALPPFLASHLRHIQNDGYSYRDLTLSGCPHPVEAVPSPSRRRLAWALGNYGKTLVLLRDGYTDPLDFISCLCCHIFEARKFRQRLQTSFTKQTLELISTKCHEETEAAGDQEALDEVHDSALKQLPLNSAEKAGLKKLWPTDLIKRIRDMLMHREDYTIRIDNSTARKVEMRPYDKWIITLHAAIAKLLRLPSVTGSLPDNMEVHIVSSNTHSVRNCLSAAVHAETDKILEWGAEHEPNLVNDKWHCPTDRIYALLPGYFKAHPHLKQDFTTTDERNGIVRISNTSLTSIVVDLIDLNKLTESPNVDPAVKLEKRDDGTYRLLVNIDYAFGAQAEGIMRVMLDLFGCRLKSVNVLGKAGGTVGKRGDIQYPTNLLFSKASLVGDTCDELSTPCNTDPGLTAATLKEMSGRDVHEGCVLTVPGTLLQSSKLLAYYMHIWQIVGLEMEGSYYGRQVTQAQRLGIIPSNLVTRFIYYTSDLPVSEDDSTNLSSVMQKWEGIPPLYAITRAILKRIVEA